MTEQICQKCDGMGMRVTVSPDGKRLAEACECQHERRIYQLHRRAQLPQRYQGCTLDSYKYDYPGADPSLWKAFNLARGFVYGYPATTNGNGILFSLATSAPGKLISRSVSCRRLCLRRASRRCSATTASF